MKNKIDTRDERIKLRLTKQEKKTITTLARKHGYFQLRNGKKEVNVSKYIRDMSLQKV